MNQQQCSNLNSESAAAPAAERSARVAIIGAGPIGLETALAAVQAGHSVRIYERTNVAANVNSWGHITLFTPFAINASTAGQAILAAHNEPLPSPEALLTGHEFRDQYLLPLSRIQALADCIHAHCEVVAVGRPHLWKADDVADSKRANDGFQLLIRDHSSERSHEFVSTADYVCDCSGTYPHHNWMGAGGIPAIGEQDVLCEQDYRIPDILGRDCERFANRATMIVGSGYSAATAVVSLHEMSQRFPQTQAIWLTRTDRRPPLSDIADDTLPERRQLVRRANALARADAAACRWYPSSRVHQLQRNTAGQIAVRLSTANESPRTELVDQVIVQTGYRPDRSLYEELQVHECYASQGPIKLAATLMASQSQDCMTQPTSGEEVLLNPEPQLFIIGSKSYGRDSRFLLRTGLNQIEMVMNLIADREEQR